MFAPDAPWRTTTPDHAGSRRKATIVRTIKAAGLALWDVTLSDGTRVRLLGMDTRDARLQGNQIGSRLRPIAHVTSITRAVPTC